MGRQGQNNHSNTIGVIAFSLLILFIGLFESYSEAGFSKLTNGIITFDTVTRIGILTTVIVGLNLLMGFAGQVSLGQGAFYGMGAYISGILTARAMTIGLPLFLAESWWWPWLLMVGAMLFTGGLTYLVGRPILRLKGHYLGMATLGLGIVIVILFRENFGINPSSLSLTGGSDGIPGVPRLRIGSYELWPIARYYYLVWGVAILGIVLGINIVNSRVGRALRALHSSDIAAETIGIDTSNYKTWIFAISTMYASLAGSLYAHFQAALSPPTFGFVASLELVVMAAVGGMASIWGAPFGVAAIFSIRELLRSRLHLFVEGATGAYEVVAFGLMLILIMIFAPDGILKLFGNGLRRLIPKREAQSAPTTSDRARGSGNLTFIQSSYNSNGSVKPLLELQELTKQFGGLVAVNEVSSQVMPGQIKAIIGPNGAGKTTLYNLITNIYPVTKGDVRFDGESILEENPSTLAQLGITRTFQNIKLFSNMSVLENLMVGQHVRTNSGFFDAAFRTRAAKREETMIRERANELLAFVGLTHLADSPATELPFGLQRKLEIARALATQPKLILLDEPAAGLNNTESQELMMLIRQIREMGVTILLVEHDMDVVMGLADEILVLEYGVPIADDLPQAVQQNPKVIAAYLGEDEPENQ